MNGESRERAELRYVVLQESRRLVPETAVASLKAALVAMLRCASLPVRILVLAGLACTGCAASSHQSPDDEPLTWRVATYNIHHARGMDDSVSVARIADVLRSLDADLIALQEVDERVTRSGGEDQAARLGALLGMEHAFGSFMNYQGGRYGLAILSRCRIEATDTVRLTEGNEPRVALAVQVVPPAGDPLTFVNVHFDWVGDDALRFAQAQEVAEYLDAIRGDYVIAGDFNDQPGSRTLALFQVRAREAEKPRGARMTFPATAPEREIDFLFAAPIAGWEVGHVEVIEEPVASDHLPVIAELRTDGGGTAVARRPAC